MQHRIFGKTAVTTALALTAALLVLVPQKVATQDRATAPKKSENTALLEAMKNAPAKFDCNTSDWFAAPSHWMVD